MNIIIGDIGNTVIKICIIDVKSFKIKKELHFVSNKVYSQKFLNKKIKSIKKYKPFNKIALFSSVVPKYAFIINKFLKKILKIKLFEIKNKKINKIIKINVKNKNQVRLTVSLLILEQPRLLMLSLNMEFTMVV